MKKKDLFISSSKTVILYVSALMICILLSCCSKHKKRDQMSAEELSQKAFVYLDKKKNDDAIVYLEELMGRFPDHANIGQYKMLLAELYFKTENYAAAQELYEHFNQFYPADNQAEYSKYKSLLAMFNQTLSTDCDQTETESTLQLCREYLQNEHYKKYSAEVANIKKICENKLIDKEVYVFNFYLKQENYDAAHARLKHLKEKYLGVNDSLQARLLYLECKLAKKERNPILVKQKLAALAERYPESKFTQMAQSVATPRLFEF